MSKAKITFATYVFLDVVKFSGRPQAAQAEIVQALNEIVLKSIEPRLNIPEDRIIFIPTGDGICIALLERPGTEFDAHMSIALNVIKQLHAQATDPQATTPGFQVRIGINSGTDTEVEDINHHRNMAGKGINMAQRIMSLADKNQILIGETVYAFLQNHDEYPTEPPSFNEFKTTVKHDEPITVYQYIAEKHLANGLSKEMPDAFRYPDIKKPARLCGINNLYPCRNDQVIEDVKKQISAATKRVWLLGIDLSVGIRLEELLPTLVNKHHELKTKEQPSPVKLLLLDALRSPAIFRTFLESNREWFVEIMEAEKKANKETDKQRLHIHPLFKQKLYTDYEKAHYALEGEPALWPGVRYHAHNPNCWLAIIDDTAYFQPYSFGRSASDAQGDSPIGHLMPVFKFERGAEVDTFNLLEDHYHKLWLTSDMDMFHVGAAIADKKRVARLIFQARRAWFQHVNGVLRLNRDQRAYPRQPCRSSIPLRISWNLGQQTQEIETDIRNFSREGILLEIKNTIVFPFESESVTLIIPSESKEDDLPVSIYLKEGLIEPTDGLFKVTRVSRVMEKDKVRIRVALKADKEVAARRRSEQH